MALDPLNSSNLEQLVLKELSQLSQVSQSMLPMSLIGSLTFAWSNSFSNSDRFLVIGLYSLTLSPLSSHSMGSPDRKLPDNLICNSFFSKFPSRYFGFTGINQRPAGRYFGLTGICNSRRSRFFSLTG